MAPTQPAPSHACRSRRLAHRSLTIVGVVALVSSLGACSSSAKSASSPSKTTTQHATSDSSTRDTTVRDTADTASSDTADTGESTSTDTASSDSQGSGTGTSACDLATSSDLTAAGIEGKISRGSPLASTLNDDKASTVCEFMISAGDKQMNLLVTLSPNGGDDMYTLVGNSFADVQHPIDGIGDRAEYSADNSDDAMDHGYARLQVVAQVRKTVLIVKVPGALLANEQNLTSLARILAARLS